MSISIAQKPVTATVDVNDKKVAETIGTDKTLVASQTYQEKIQIHYRNSNLIIRVRFAEFWDSHFSSHFTHTRSMILKGASKIPDSLKGRAIIFGPGLIEPLSEISKKFKEVVLVDYDEFYLKKLVSPFKNVTYKVIDLSGGLCKKLADLLATYDKSGFSIDDLKKIIGELCHFKPDLQTIIKELGQADYVVSSLVSVMLSCQIVEVIKMIIEKYALSGTREDVIYLRETLSNITEPFHIQTLFNLVKETGFVYYADTMRSLTVDDSDDDKSNVKIVNVTREVLPTTLELVKKIFQVKEQKVWNWSLVPENNWHYEVEGYLMTKPKTPNAKSNG